LKYTTDRDGKSKTASAVDQEHYPEQHEVESVGSDLDGLSNQSNGLPSHQQIAERAFGLWHARGCPAGSAEQDWLQAEAELQSEAASNPLHGTASGSVQR